MFLSVCICWMLRRRRKKVQDSQDQQSKKGLPNHSTELNSDAEAAEQPGNELQMSVFNSNSTSCNEHGREGQRQSDIVPYGTAGNILKNISGNDIKDIDDSESSLFDQNGTETVNGGNHKETIEGNDQ